MNGTPGEWWLISGYHFVRMFSNEFGFVIEKQRRNTSVWGYDLRRAGSRGPGADVSVRSRGDAAGAARIVRADASRRRRGRRADSPCGRVAATAAAATWIVRADASRRRAARIVRGAAPDPKRETPARVQRPEAVVVLLARGVPQPQADGLAVDHDVGAVIVKDRRDVLARELVRRVGDQQTRLTDGAVAHHDALDILPAGAGGSRIGARGARGRMSRGGPRARAAPRSRAAPRRRRDAPLGGPSRRPRPAPSLDGRIETVARTNRAPRPPRAMAAAARRRGAPPRGAGLSFVWSASSVRIERVRRALADARRGAERATATGAAETRRRSTRSG